MRSILGLIATGVIVWVVYVTFMGTDEEKQTRDELFKGVKQTTTAVGKIFSSEKGKYSAGQYDTELQAIGNLISSLKTKKEESGVDYSQELAELEQKKAMLEASIGKLENATIQNQAIEKAALEKKPLVKKGAKPAATPKAVDTQGVETQVNESFEDLQESLKRLEEKLNG